MAECSSEKELNVFSNLPGAAARSLTLTTHTQIVSLLAHSTSHALPVLRRHSRRVLFCRNFAMSARMATTCRNPFHTGSL